MLTGGISRGCSDGQITFGGVDTTAFVEPLVEQQNVITSGHWGGEYHRVRIRSGLLMAWLTLADPRTVAMTNISANGVDLELGPRDIILDTGEHPLSKQSKGTRAEPNLYSAQARPKSSSPPPTPPPCTPRSPARSARPTPESTSSRATPRSRLPSPSRTKCSRSTAATSSSTRSGRTTKGSSTAKAGWQRPCRRRTWTRFGWWGMCF